MILVVKPHGGRDEKLLVVMDPVYLGDVIDVSYNCSEDGRYNVHVLQLNEFSIIKESLYTCIHLSCYVECEFTLTYTQSDDSRALELPMICNDIETKLVWKGLLRDRLYQLRRIANQSLSDQVSHISLSSH